MEPLVRVREILERTPPIGGLDQALRTLGELGKPREILPFLRQIGASDPNPRHRYQAERVLKLIQAQSKKLDFGDPIDPERIRMALGHDDGEVRIQAVRALRMLAPEVSLPLVLAAIERPEEDPWILASLVSVLGLAGSEGQLDLARGYLQHESHRVASNALLALFALAPQEGVEEALKRLKDPDPRMRTSAIMAAFRSEPEAAWAQIADMIRSPKVWLRTSGSYLAAKLSHPKSEEVLLESLVQEDDPGLVQRTLRWLGKSGSRAAIPTLELLANLGDPRYRGIARQSLDELEARLEAQVGQAISLVFPEAEDRPISLTESLVAPVGTDFFTPVKEDVVETFTARTMLGVNSEIHTPEELPHSSPTPESPTEPEAPERVSWTHRLGLDPKDPDRHLKVVKNTAGGLGFLIFGLLIHILVFRKEPVQEKPKMKSQIETRSQARSQPVRVQPELVDGRLDLNSLPGAGRTGVFFGTLRTVLPDRIEIATPEGVVLRLLLSEPLSSPPPSGEPLTLTAKIRKKSRQGIELAPGATWELGSGSSP